MDEQGPQHEGARVEDTSVIFKEVFWDQARSVRETGNCNLDSEIVRQWVKSIWQFNTEKAASIDPSLKVELTALNACSVAVGALAFCVLSRDHSERPLPVDWGSKQDGGGSFALYCLLVQYVNHSMSVVRLCQDGFDNSAKILVRTMLEMTRIVLVVSADSGYMQSYLNSGKNEQCRKEWRKKSETDEILRRLGEIECEMGLSRQTTDYMSVKRMNTYKYLCQATHSSIQEMAANSFTEFQAPDPNSVRSMMFGAPSSRLRPLLIEAMTTSFVLVNEIMTIFASVHKFSATAQNENWNNFNYLYHTLNLIWLSHFTEGSIGDEPREYLKSLGIGTQSSQ
jgi:hypothetical protein